MSGNLKARLGFIRSTRESHGEVSPPSDAAAGSDILASWPGWTEAGYMTLKREIIPETPLAFGPGFPRALAIVIPDLAPHLLKAESAKPEELLFFDLETTGLSGGAGTLAFLAAFGQLVNGRLVITQYLLLDYPGECDFVERITEEISRSGTPILVTYNGKSFDSQILNNRCLMKGIKVPAYFHADLLHPARRLWKNILPDCSQATIETSILGLDRTGDIPGALAPEIWFSFLKNNDNRDLLGICDHNKKDIIGLVHLFFAMKEIAALTTDSAGINGENQKDAKKYVYDEEALALAWDRALKKNPAAHGEDDIKLGNELLEKAAKKGWNRAAFVLGLNYFNEGLYREGRQFLQKIVKDNTVDLESRNNPGAPLKARAYKALAIDAEWRLRDNELALDYTSRALALEGLSGGFMGDLEKRKLRLTEKKRIGGS